MPAVNGSAPLLRLDGFGIELNGRNGRIAPVRDVELSVRPGEAVAVLGESGSGKTLTALSLLGLLPPKSSPSVRGVAEFEGGLLPPVGSRAWRRLRGREIGMIFQDPLSAMNPSMTVGNQIAELYRKRAGKDRASARREALEAMERVRIPDAERRYRAYPHQFSGGMRQRAMIAMAIALGPKLLIADEPTTALDVTVQAEILTLLAELRARDGMSIVLITHDLAVARSFADSVMVMYAGRTIETGSAATVLDSPGHPYTAALRESVPRRDGVGLRHPIPGAPPQPSAIPAGCAFHPRCAHAWDDCRAAIPELRTLAGRTAACHHMEELLA